MPTIINNIEFNNEFTGGTTDFLKANIGEKTSTEIKLDVTWFSKANTDNEFSFVNGGKTITRETGSWWDDGFNVNDIIIIAEANAANNDEYTIDTISLDGLTLTTTSNFGFTEDSTTSEVYGFTPITGINFWYNLIENSYTPYFVSLVDIIEQRFNASNINRWSTTPINFIPQGTSQGWVNGSYTVEGQTPHTPSSSTPSGKSFTSGSPTITRVEGSWITDAYKANDIICVSGANAANNGIYKILSVTALILTCTTNFGFTEDSTTAVVQMRSYQRFEINHTYFINPFFLADQLEQLKAGNPLPDYFFGDNCLKYVYQIDALIDATNPNLKHRFTSDVDEEHGNTGWFDEIFNTGISPLTIKSCNYTDTITSSPVDAIQYCRKTDIEIKIESSVSFFHPPLDTTEFTLNHCYLPLNETRYQDTATDFQANFIFDRAFQESGEPAVNGDYSLFEDIQATVINEFNITITATIDLTALSIDEFDLTDRNYCLWVGVKGGVDRLAVKCDVAEYICGLDNADLWNCDTKFYQHPYCHFNGKDDLKCWIEDGILSTSVFYVDIGAGTDFNELSDLYLTLEAEHITHGTFELERYDFTSAVTNAIISGGVQQIDFNTTRGFKLKSGHDKNYVKLFRRSDLDVGTKKYYQLDYAFKIRWEDWIFDANVNTEFYDSSLGQNGLNKDWFEKDDKAGWDIKFRVYADVLEPDSENHTTQFKHTSNVSIIDYEDDNCSPTGNCWTCEIKTYDEADSEMTPNILSFANTKIKAVFTKQADGTMPINPYGIIEIEEYQVGGIYNIRQISNLYDTEVDTSWISQTDDKRAKVTTDATHVYVEAILNFTKLDQNKNYKLSARMGDNFLTQLYGDKLWCCGANSKILYTTDSGVNWNEQTSGIVEHLRDIYFINALNGWCCGNSRKMLYTSDEGINWNEQTIPITSSNVLYSVYFIDSLRGWCCGTNGYILHTTDGGTNWIEQRTGGNTLKSVYFINALNGWCCGDSGRIFGTIDGGSNWIEQTSGVAQTLSFIYFIDTLNGWCVGYTGKILYTSDGGNNWNEQISGITEHINSVCFIDSQKGWICGVGGKILYTINGGNDWIEQTTPIGNTLYAIKFINMKNGWCVGHGGKILYTINGGGDWTEQTSGIADTLMSITGV